MYQHLPIPVFDTFLCFVASVITLPRDSLEWLKEAFNLLIYASFIFVKKVICYRVIAFEFVLTCTYCISDCFRFLPERDYFDTMSNSRNFG